jgi:polysaccharide export outer membrane protein
MPMPRSSRLRTLPGLSAIALLGGCAALPASGPTAHQVVQGTQGDRNQIGMRLIDVDSAALASVASVEAATDRQVPTLVSLAREGNTDTVGPGDVLTINIYEVGVSLFGGSRPSQAPETFDPSARGELFPEVTVDREGAIKLPYVGRLQVAGRTPTEIQTMLERAYAGRSQSPQAVVQIKTNLSETVYVTGDVNKPGRIDLTLQRERLLDVIASAGGAVSQTQDMVVRFSRGGQYVEERLDRIRAGAADDLLLAAGDRIELIKEPQTFVVLGATAKVSQLPFDETNLTLAEAIARASGPNDAQADPKGVFLFRYAAAATPGGERVPTIYRLNMMQPANYFLAQRFAMRDKDVILISNAAINSTAKLVAIANQLFSPFVTARAISR